MPWLVRLQNLYDRADRPTYRKLADDTGISHTHIANIFLGRTVPSTEMLFRLLGGLGASPEAINRTVEQFLSEEPQRTLKPGPVTAAPKRPTQADIQELAAAIRELSAVLRTRDRPEPSPPSGR